MLQDLMYGERGFTGREERYDRPEALTLQIRDVESRKVHPSTYFYTQEQWDNRLAEIADRYNSEKQEGKYMRHPDTRAPLSPEEAFQLFYPRDNPPRSLEPRVRALLSHRRIDGLEVRQGKGVLLPSIRGKVHRYFSEDLGRWTGRRVTAWWNPDAPEFCAFSLDGQLDQVITAPLHISPNALEGGERLETESRNAEGFASPPRTLYRALKAKFDVPRRILLADQQSLGLCRQIETQKAAVADRETRQRRLADRSRQVSTRAGIPLALAETESQLAAQEGLANFLKGR